MSHAFHTAQPTAQLTTQFEEPVGFVLGHVLGWVVGRVGPNFGALGGTGDLRAIVGALLSYGLLVAALMLVVSAATWALASGSGSWHTAQKAKTGVLVALGGATLTGGALAWANWLLDLGAHL